MCVWLCFFHDISFQYMKAIRATLTTSQPVISEDEYETMFFKIPQLHACHQEFLDGLRKKIDKWDSKTTIGEEFKVDHFIKYTAL